MCSYIYVYPACFALDGNITVHSGTIYAYPQRAGIKG